MQISEFNFPEFVYRAVSQGRLCDQNIYVLILQLSIISVFDEMKV